MISVDEARRRIIESMRPMAPEQISLKDALGRVLAEDVASRRTQPPAAVSAMDGYAVRAVDVAQLPANLKIIGYSQAGGAYDGVVGPGETVRIFTGAPVPAGADSIVIQENTEADGDKVSVIDGTAPAGRYVRPAGLDFKEGQILLTAGKALTARDIGLAAGMNVPWLKVRRRPRIALLATGDEIVMPGDPIGPNQIVSTNGLSLAAFITAEGGSSIDLGIAPDSENALASMAAGAKGADMLVTMGGASVGDHDLVQKVLGDIGLEVDFWKIAMRPGKPLIFGHLGDTPILGLPGNPVSSMVCAVIYLRAALRAMLAMEAPESETVELVLGADLDENDERQDYLRARIDTGPGGALTAMPFNRQDSSMFAHLAHADCLIIRAPFAPAIKAGERVTALPLSGGIVSI
ncbi:MAG: molybdopterin molybdotransferase MoeA [Rhodospirillales bacterium]|nr:molybdopterin molybdotransferase MoeA [Rhodospirillales bacterium]